MKTVEEQIKVMQHFLKGGRIEAVHRGRNDWENSLKPLWNWADFDYRVGAADPYAGLKAAAADPAKQLRIKGTAWVDSGDWDWQFDSPIDQYEIRNKPRRVKLLAWFDGAGLAWHEEYHPVPPTWLRMPNQDIEGEVEE